MLHPVCAKGNRFSPSRTSGTHPSALHPSVVHPSAIQTGHPDRHSNPAVQFDVQSGIQRAAQSSRSDRPFNSTSNLPSHQPFNLASNPTSRSVVQSATQKTVHPILHPICCLVQLFNPLSIPSAGQVSYPFIRIMEMFLKVCANCACILREVCVKGKSSCPLRTDF
jgi:hypothetical protein